MPEQLTCARCHSDSPHGDFDPTTGQLPGSPRDAGGLPVLPYTDLCQGYQHRNGEGLDQAAFFSGRLRGRGGWVPNEVRESNVVPTYQWFDGTSQVYVLGQVPTENENGEKAFGVPNGAVDSADAKIYPMKEHLSVAAQHDASGLMIPHSTFTFFTQKSFDEAVRVGMEEEGLEGSYTLVDVHTYQTINHGVEDDGNALECGPVSWLHESPGCPRLDLQGELGYEVKGRLQQVCTQCHEN